MTTKDLILSIACGEDADWITYSEVEEVMKVYAKMKCKELLLMVAEKAMGREGLSSYKILAVDLDDFIK